MKKIGAVTIGKLIEAHYEKDEHKFKAYAEFIAEAYKERGEERAERIIRSKIDGSYKNKSVAVTLDNERKEELKERCNILDKSLVTSTKNNIERQKIIDELKEEKAELKLKLEALEGQIPWKDIKDKSEVIGKLTKAKELIKRLMQELVVSNRPYDEVELLVKDVEQFLNSEVEK